LSNYLQTYPSTVLVVSHDRAFLNEVATDIIHQHSERLDYYKGANFGILIPLASVMASCADKR
jgi:ATP-binding cassette subfamily F protein 3